MADHVLIPAGEVEVEIAVSNSRFIASLSPAFSVEEARDFIRVIKARYPDASHHVPVFLIGHGASTIAHSSDDGEPSGTAGRPALAVLQGSGLGDVVVVVTRYFGGTKLGTGGLVRAYGDAVREVLKATPLAKKVPTLDILLNLPYRLFEQVQLLAEKQHAIFLEKDFGADVSLHAIQEDWLALVAMMRSAWQQPERRLLPKTRPRYAIEPTGLFNIIKISPTNEAEVCV